MPGSHSKKDKLKKKIAKVRKAGVNLPYDLSKKREQLKKFTKDKKFIEELVGPATPHGAVYDPEIEKDAPFDSKTGEKVYPGSTKRQIDQMKGVEQINYKTGTPINPRRQLTEKEWEANKEFNWAVKKKLAKMRKADQQDINRVKRWDSRSFNKKKERAGTTEPVFFIEKSREIQLNKQKGTYPASDLSGKPMPGMKGDELMANLRNRLAKIRKAEEDPYQQMDDAIDDINQRTDEEGKVWTDLEGRRESSKNLKKRKKKKRLLPFGSTKGAKVRKANGGIAPNYNNPSKVRKKKTATKTAAGMANIGKKPWLQKDYLKKRGRRLELQEQREKTALRSNVNKGVDRVNVKKKGRITSNPVVRPKTDPKNKAYLKRRQKANYVQNRDTINPQEEDPTKIVQNATTIGRKPTYFGKTRKARKLWEEQGYKKKPSWYGETCPGCGKEITEYPSLSRVDNKTHLCENCGVGEAMSEYKNEVELDEALGGDRKDAKLRNRIARIRKAGEQIDPRVKKRKTVRPDSPVQKVSQLRDRVAEMKTAKEHNHKIEFKSYEGSQYRRASLAKQEGKYAKYWLLNAKQTNGNGWGVSPVSIAKNIHKFIGRPFVITAKQWIPESEYGEQFEHPYLPTNNIDNIINHQEKFRVGSIVDVVEKGGDYHAVIEINSKFANMMLPPFCSPAIFQNNPGEADGEISDWEALHLAGLMEDPAYGARIALLKGSCMGTAEACSIQFKAAKQTTMCPKKKAKLVRRINRLGD